MNSIAENSRSISVIIPARNAGRTLAQTLDSLIAQTHQNWQAIIIDDGSTDDTAALIAAAARRDPRFTALQGAAEGVAAARNLGIAAATGEFLHFLDADDWNDPSFYATMLAALANAPDATLAYCSHRHVMPDGALTRVYRAPHTADSPIEDFARGCLIAIHAILTRRATISRIGGFDPKFRNCEDWDLWQRVARLGGAWIFIDQPLAYYRVNTASLSRNATWMLENSSIIIATGFGPDPRMNGIPHAHPTGAATARGSQTQAMAMNAIWMAAAACGQSLDQPDIAQSAVQIGGAAIQNHPHPGLVAYDIAFVILEGFLSGRRMLPQHLAAAWPSYGQRLTAFIAWLAGLWRAPGIARAITYHIEFLIAYYEPVSTPRHLNHTVSLCIDPLEPPETRLPPGADQLCVRLAVGNGDDRFLTAAALGTFTPSQWLEAAAFHGYIGFRHYRAALGRSADLRLLRNTLAGIVKHPGILKHPSGYRAALKGFITRTIYDLRPPSDIPGSHRAALAAIQSRATAHARQHAIKPVEPPKRHRDYAVDPNARQQHFETFFTVEDPWNYTAPYEQQKYQRQIEILGDAKFGTALELACAEGHFTLQLASRVTTLLATDIAPTALARAQSRCAAHRNIAYRRLDVAAEPIPAGMDLIICSEMLYYLRDEAELAAVARKIAAALPMGGIFVTAHAHVLKDDPTRTAFDWGTLYGAATIAKAFEATPGLVLEHRIDTDLYRIDRYRRADDPPPPVIKAVLDVEPPGPEVARYIVWGGAKILRAAAQASETRTKIPVLMYHDIASDGPLARTRYRIPPAMFKAQLRWLRANGFHTINSAGLHHHLATGEPFRGRPVVITFDDGFQSFADNAWPIILAHDFTAEMFVVTDHAGGTANWDDDKGPPGRLMDPATIARLHRDGVSFGSHTATHRPVDGLAAADLAAELANSSAALAEWLGHPPVSLAAPFSITDHRLPWMAAQTGYQICYGASLGPAGIGMNPFDLPRIEIRGDHSLDDFIAHLEPGLRP